MLEHRNGRKNDFNLTGLKKTDDKYYIRRWKKNCPNYETRIWIIRRKADEMKYSKGEGEREKLVDGI